MAVYRWAAHRRLREVPFGGGTWTTRPHLNPIMLLRDQCTAVAVYVMKTHLPEQARQHPLFSVQCHGAKGFRFPSSGCCEPDRRRRGGVSHSAVFSPANARLPVNSSNNTHPNAQMSARLSTGLPCACSGLIYAAVPTVTPGRLTLAVIVGVSEGGAAPSSRRILARPKSRTLTRSSGVVLMWAGFKSR
jgi:hypothetical protein